MWDSVPITIPKDDLDKLYNEALTTKSSHGKKLLKALRSKASVPAPRSNLICLCPCSSSPEAKKPTLKDGHLLYITPHPEEAHHLNEALDEDDEVEEEAEQRPKTYKVASAYHPEQDIFYVKPAEGTLTEALQDLYVGDDGVPANLDTRNGTREVVIIVSAKSGSGLGVEIWNSIVKPIIEHFGLVHLQPQNSVNSTVNLTSNNKNSNLGYSLFITDSKDNVEHIARTSLTPSSPHVTHQNILLLSGDTVVSEILNNLPPENPLHAYTRTITVLPTGTGNALSSSHHKLYSPLTNFLLGSPHSHPTFTANFSSGARWTTGPPIKAPIKGAVVLSWGFHACLVADSDGETYRTRFGKERFAVAARENLTPAPHVFRGKITIWDANNKQKQLSGLEHFYVLATLVSNLEKTLTVAPDAPKPLPVSQGREKNEAAFTIVTIASGTAPERTMDIMKLAYNNGAHVHEPEVTIERARRIRIEFLEPDWVLSGKEEQVNPAWTKGRYRRVCLDGATAEVEEGGWVDAEIQGSMMGLLKG